MAFDICVRDVSVETRDHWDTKDRRCDCGAKAAGASWDDHRTLEDCLRAMQQRIVELETRLGVQREAGK
jgi:hypothetical protein